MGCIMDGNTDPSDHDSDVSSGDPAAWNQYTAVWYCNVYRSLYWICNAAFGTCLFTGMSVSGVSMQKLVKAILPFIISMLVVLLLITFIPQLTLWIAK